MFRLTVHGRGRGGSWSWSGGMVSNIGSMYKCMTPSTGHEQVPQSSLIEQQQSIFLGILSDAFL